MTSDPLYRSDAAVGARDRAGVPEVVFYQVKHRFVDNERSIPDEAADIIYYTLAIGHHTGIIDASEERLRCPLELYERICGLLPEGEARYKLEAVLRGGEVYIDKFKAPELRTAVEALWREVVGGVSDDSADDSDGGSARFLEAAPDRADELEEIAREAVALDAGPVRTEDAGEWLRVFDAMLAQMAINPAASITGRRRGL